MRRCALALLFVFAPTLFAQDSPAVPQAVAALEQLKPRADAGPTSWTAGPYLYDGAGNISAIGTESFAYDNLNRLKLATIRGPDAASLQTQTYTYDGYGNLTSASKLGETVTLPASVTTNRLDGLGYDAAGNVIASGTQHYDYDAVGMLNAMRIGASAQPRMIYAYTADDERLLAFDVSTGTTHWTVRGLDNKVLRDFRQTGSNWALERDYVYRDGLPLAALKPGGEVEHYTVDHLGTPRLITNAAGQKIAYHAYWPFGEEWSPGTAQEASPLKFTGHERDADPAGGSAPLDYMHARYYRASWGRFLAVDPVLGSLANPQSWNRYAYVLNNPLSHADPDGRCIDGCVIEVIALFSLVVGTEAYLQAPSATVPGRSNAQALGSEIASIPGRIKDALKSSVHPSSIPPSIVVPTTDGIMPIVLSENAGGPSLPQNPDQLLEHGYKETSNPKAAEAGHRSFENPSTGDKVRFDKGMPGAPGQRGQGSLPPA